MLILSFHSLRREQISIVPKMSIVAYGGSCCTLHLMIECISDILHKQQFTIINNNSLFLSLSCSWYSVENHQKRTYNSRSNSTRLILRCAFIKSHMQPYWNDMCISTQSFVMHKVTVSAIISACLAQVHIHRDTSYHKKKQSTDVWASSSSKKQGNGTQLVTYRVTVFIQLQQRNHWALNLDTKFEKWGTK